MFSFQFNTTEELQDIIQQQESLGFFFHEVQYLFTGNFVVFGDTEYIPQNLPVSPLSIEERIQTLEEVTNILLLGGL